MDDYRKKYIFESYSSKEVSIVPICFPLMHYDFIKEYFEKIVMPKVYFSKVVILWITCPGGSVVISDYIKQKIKEMQDKGKYVIAYIDIAASGGYDIAKEANYVVANKNSMVGNVGTLFAHEVNEKELKQKGYNYDSINLYNEDLNFYFSDNFKNFISKNLDLFKNNVQMKRRLQNNDALQGQIYTGRAAKKIGLVDSDDGFLDVVKLSKEVLQTDEVNLNCVIDII